MSLRSKGYSVNPPDELPVDDLPHLSRIRHAVSDKTLASLSIPDDRVIEALETTGRGWFVELDGTIVAFTIGDALTGSI